MNCRVCLSTVDTGHICSLCYGDPFADKFRKIVSELYRQAKATGHDVVIYSPHSGRTERETGLRRLAKTKYNKPFPDEEDIIEVRDFTDNVLRRISQGWIDTVNPTIDESVEVFRTMG